uniref:Putative GAF sensor protein n=1 Tax=Rhodopseudomonas palustris (strain BisA53) TaxID=316055 RepID=Q07NE3_RHOP5
MEQDVLTTSQAAKLLGISVRTAQLLVESGSLTSWKTPGGHRRVYRADVMALMKRPGQTAAVSSALVVVVASPDRLPLYERLLSTVNECTADLHSDVYSASFAIGARLPAAVIVDLVQDNAERIYFVRKLISDPAIGRGRLIVVANAPAADVADVQARIDSPELLPDALRALLADAAKSPVIAAAEFPVAANEAQRLGALQRSGLVDTAPEKSFDRVTWLASHALAMPISLMTLLTPDRQWFKSRQGIDMAETPRSWAFCNRTILQRGVFAVEDLARDKRFADNPAVADAPHFRFYAGAPVIDRDGFALGSVCVIDYAPRKLDQDQTETLRALAALASDQVRLRATDRDLRRALSDRSQKD